VKTTAYLRWFFLGPVNDRSSTIAVALKAGNKGVKKLDFGPFSVYFHPFFALFCTKNSAFRAFSLWKFFDILFVMCLF
jgi:hypothetical protein